MYTEYIFTLNDNELKTEKTFEARGCYEKNRYGRLLKICSNRISLDVEQFIPTHIPLLLLEIWKNLLTFCNECLDRTFYFSFISRNSGSSNCVVEVDQIVYIHIHDTINP